MKIGLISLRRDSVELEGMEDVGLYMVSSYLRQNGMEVKTYFMRENNPDFTNIVQFSPDLVIISTYNWYPCVIEKYNNMEIVGVYGMEIKKLIANVKIALGGFPVSYYWEEVMKEFSFVDFIICKEGEQTALELANCLKNHQHIEDINGIAYRTFDNQILKTEFRNNIVSLDVLPLPDRDITDLPKFQVATIASSRGCKRNCSFCIVRDYWGEWRAKSPDRIIEEIKELYYKFSCRAFNFIDESFEDSDNGIQRLVEFTEGILQAHLKISYYVQVRAESYKLIGDELIKRLKDSGLCGVAIGIETFSESDRKLYGKFASVSDNVSSIDFYRKHGIAVAFNMINFNPYSTFQSLRDNLFWLEKLGYSYDIKKFCTFFQLHRGTRLYDKVVQDALLIKSQTNQIIDIFSYTYQDERIEKLANFLREYLRSKMISARASEIHFYGHEFSFFLHSLINLSGGEKTVKEVIDDYFEKVGVVFKKIGERNTYRVSEVLTLAENAWDQKHAEELLNYCYTSIEMQNDIKELQRLRLSVLRKINRINNELLSIMIPENKTGKLML